MTGERSGDLGSLSTSGGWLGLRSFALGWDEFDSCAGSVAVGEDLVGYAADVGFVDGVDLVELVEELAPVAEAGLVLG